MKSVAIGLPLLICAINTTLDIILFTYQVMSTSKWSQNTALLSVCLFKTTICNIYFSLGLSRRRHQDGIRQAKDLLGERKWERAGTDQKSCQTRMWREEGSNRVWIHFFPLRL